MLGERTPKRAHLPNDDDQLLAKTRAWQSVSVNITEYLVKLVLFRCYEYVFKTRVDVSAATRE